MDKINFLRKLDLFKSLSEKDLTKLCSMAQEVAVKKGKFLFKEGEVGEAMYVILNGELEVLKEEAGQVVQIALRSKGEVIGEMSVIDMAPRSASVRAFQDSKLLKIGHDSVYSLLSSSPDAAISIFHTVSERLRSNEALLVQREKMAGLGTLAAGLAHEINNPTAAAIRNVQSLETEINKLIGDDIKRYQKLQTSSLELSDRESRWTEILEAKGIENSWEIASILSRWNIDFDSQEDLSSLASKLEAASLLSELKMSLERIAEIVKSIKTYSYLDQAPVQQVDINQGIENTLVILRHKLKKGIQIVKEFDPDLPKIEGRGSELNQVWTNLIDNAIDALEENLNSGKEAKITIRTTHDERNVKVVIEDNGPGIPENIRKRIFEPFYTTKQPGAGTGLGLHISYNIIVVKHHGRISVESKTVNKTFSNFIILLPQRI